MPQTAQTVSGEDAVLRNVRAVVYKIYLPMANEKILLCVYSSMLVTTHEQYNKHSHNIRQHITVPQ